MLANVARLTIAGLASFQGFPSKHEQFWQMELIGNKILPE